MDRKKLEEAIKEKTKEGKIPCVLCFKIAEDLGIPKREMGKILNEMKIKIGQWSDWLFRMRGRSFLI